MSSNVWKRVGVGLALVLAGSVLAQELDMEISGFRVPEYDEQGKMTSQLFGDHAEIDQGGDVSITGVRMEFYREDETFMTVESPTCLYNQKTQIARSDATVFADMDGLQLRGRGYRLNAAKRTVKLFADSEVTIADVMQKETEGLLGETNVTVITSVKLFLDYSQRTAFFEENVQVADSELTMDCESLDLRFGENNKIDWIEALTNVKIFHEGREAYAERVVYDVKVNEFLLEGNPRLIEGRNMLQGDRIRFWRESGKMICEPAARLVIFPDDEMNADMFEK